MNEPLHETKLIEYAEKLKILFPLSEEYLRTKNALIDMGCKIEITIDKLKIWKEI